MTIKAMSDKDYFADQAIDQTGLKQWMISPAKYVDHWSSRETAQYYAWAVSSTRTCLTRTLKAMP